MTELLTAAQMRAIEQAAIASGQVTGLELMERAGQGVVAAVLEEWPELALTAHRAVVLCGPGNNGGDGFVVARLLKQRGWEVEVFLYGDPEKLPADARVNYERWGELGAMVGDREAFAAAVKLCTEPVRRGDQMGWQSDPPKADLMIDAVFGIGLTRPMDRNDLIGWKIATGYMLHPAGKTVSIDLPSGICSDSGRVLSEEGDYRPDAPYIPDPVDLCVTFHRKKFAHVIGAGAQSVRKVRVVDIGLPNFFHSSLVYVKAWETTRDRILDDTISHHKWLFGYRGLSKSEAIFSRRVGSLAHHKFAFGHALVLSGSSGRAGAARLAARSALRTGAGLVTLGSPRTAMPENAARLDAVMLREIDDAKALSEYLAGHQVNAICLGPGLGFERARELVPVALSGSVPAYSGSTVRNPPPAKVGQPEYISSLLDFGRGVVLDADALSAYADDPETLFAMLHERCVLTPHHGEFARLFPDISAKMDAPPGRGPAYSRLDAAKEASIRAGCTVLYKGADTVMVFRGYAAIHSATQDRAAPWLATAGSGDVLSGFIAGLLARGFNPLAAAETAAWLHVECALSFGPGLIAEDLPEQLPKVFRALGL